MFTFQGFYISPCLWTFWKNGDSQWSFHDKHRYKKHNHGFYANTNKSNKPTNWTQKKIRLSFQAKTKSENPQAVFRTEPCRSESFITIPGSDGRGGQRNPLKWITLGESGSKQGQVFESIFTPPPPLSHRKDIPVCVGGSVLPYGFSHALFSECWMP